MNEFKRLDVTAPATLGAVVEAVTRLSTVTEATILEMVSAGRIAELFPFEPSAGAPLPSDTVAEDELVEASTSPLSHQQREALIQSSLPADTPSKRRA